MTDKPKVIPLPTGYQPDTAPPNADEIERLQFKVDVLTDEVTHLSKLIQLLIRAQRKSK